MELEGDQSMKHSALLRNLDLNIKGLDRFLKKLDAVSDQQHPKI